MPMPTADTSPSDHGRDATTPSEIPARGLRDVAFRVHPIPNRDAKEMVEGLRGAPRLRGTRGERPLNVASYEEALLRVSRLVADFHGIRELDVNPFLLGETAEESVAVDARIRIDPAAF